MILLGSCVATARRMRSPSASCRVCPFGTLSPLMAVPLVLVSSK
jgi:hypothetical protein